MSEKKCKNFSSQFKAQVALEAIRAEHVKTVNEIAQKFGVHPTHVKHWKKMLQEHAVGVFDAARGPKGEHYCWPEFVSRFDRFKNLFHRSPKISRKDYYFGIKKLNRKLTALKLAVEDNSISTMPKFISLGNTCFCNLRCPHCWSHGSDELRNRHNSLFMEDNMLFALGKESLPFADSFSLTLNGEPLATPHLDRILAELSKYGAKLTLLTNGSLLTSSQLPMLIPIAKSIEISIDGATPFTFEAIRLGAKFKKVIQNIRLLTRTVELLPDNLRPTIAFAWTIMGSNLKELTEIVKLAGALKVPTVNTRFITIVDNDKIKHEAIEYHKRDYIIYSQMAKKLAQDLNVKLKLPPPFKEFSDSQVSPVCRENMIIKQFPKDYYEALVSSERLIDHNAVEQEATEAKNKVTEIALRRSLDAQSICKSYKLIEMQEYFNENLIKHKQKLKKIRNKADKTIKYCHVIHNSMYVSPLGDITPCCLFWHVVGNVKDDNIKDIWNGEAYYEFRRKVLGKKPFEQCVNCPEMAYVQIGTLIDEIYE